MIDYNIFDVVKSIITAYDSITVSKTVLEEIAKYSTRQYDRLKTTKNIVYRHEPANFEDMYVPLTIVNGKNNIRVSESTNILEKFAKIAILGEAGSGKSTLMQFVALQCIENKVAIPIFVELRKYNNSVDKFEDFLAKQISESYYMQIKDLFNNGNFAFILDGYDEINYVSGSEFIDQIQKFVLNFSSNKFLISSRPGTNVESLNPFYVFTINPLNENDISLFIEKVRLPYKSVSRLKSYIYGESTINDILTNPLFLSLYILSFDGNTEKIHPKKTIFLRNIIDALFSSHDSISKLGYVRDKITDLNKDELETISATLAFRSFMSHRFELTKDELFREFDLIRNVNTFKFENSKLLYDLTITTNILRNENNYYTFPHVLILEYLAATFVSNLDTDSKKFLYNGMIKNNRIQISASFIEFLYELDKKQLTKLFLIPCLELINNSTDMYEHNHISILDFIDEIINSDLITDYDPYSVTGKLDAVINYLKRNTDQSNYGSNNPLFDML
ncbi:NACHT domain-containing protein [Nostoc sp. CHAB 5834]|nr:NACHT domain-containing protein [Nostoc sp. CHAB 5834]